VLEEEKKKMVSELADLKSQNAASDRAIRQAKTFTSKRDEEHKKMKEESDLLNRTLTELNADIIARSEDAGQTGAQHGQYRHKRGGLPY